METFIIHFRYLTIYKHFSDCLDLIVKLGFGLNVISVTPIGCDITKTRVELVSYADIFADFKKWKLLDETD